MVHLPSSVNVPQIYMRRDMENMKLKDVVELVKQVLSENKFQSATQKGDPYYLLSYEEKQRWFGKTPPIEWEEIENLNRTFWEADIKPGIELTVAAAIAVNLANQCMAEYDRRGMLNKIEQLRENVSRQWLRRFSKKMKASSKTNNVEDNIYGSYNKFEFIQKLGFMYDSEAEGNADANDPNATCPLITSQLNSGWVNYKTEEKDGEIVVEPRRNDSQITPSVLLLMICTAFRNCSTKILYDDTREEAKRTRKILDIGINMMLTNDGLGNHYADVKCSPFEFYDYVEAFLTDEKRYPQDVFDFKAVNEQFLPVLQNSCLIIECLDETQTWLARRLFKDTMQNMDAMSQVEVRIIEEQQMRDKTTGKFVKPTFDTRSLIYTTILATMLHLLGERFKTVMRRYPWGNTEDALYTFDDEKLVHEYFDRKLEARKKYPVVL